MTHTHSCTCLYASADFEMMNMTHSTTCAVPLEVCVPEPVDVEA